MNLNTIIGCIVIAAGIGFITYLVVWSRKTIQHIADKDLSSAREIMGAIRNGR
jgi:hypothetical protein